MTCTVHKEILGHDQRGLKHSEVYTNLGFEITMNIAQLVELVDSCKHLTDVEDSMLFFEDTGIIEKSTKVATWDVFHR
jgi:hypothetical protein